MPDQTSNGMQCNEFELLLSDALDGVLTGTALDRFQAHARTCKACGPLFAEADGGPQLAEGSHGGGASSQPGQQYPGIHNGR